MTTPAQNPYNEFLRKVARMRKAQKEAVKFPSRQANAKVASTEREVDEFLEAVGFQNAKAKQLTFADGITLNAKEQGT